MTSMVQYTVGQRWPHPLAGEGLQAIDAPASDGLELVLVAAFPRPSEAEIRALTREPLHLGILPVGPVVMIAASAGAVQLDAPYAPGLAGPERLAEIAAAAGRAHDWPEGTARLLTLAVVDLDTAEIKGLRMVSASKAWWTSLAAAIAAASPVWPVDRDEVAARVYARWPTVKDMLADCVIVEQAGAVA